MSYKKVVLDTSVIVKWLSPKDENNVYKALLIYESLKHEQTEIIVCEFLYYEIANILFWGKKMNFKDYSSTIKTLLSLPLTTIKLTQKLIELTYNSFGKYKLSFYDALPAIIARTERCPFISADEKHHKNLPHVIFLKDYK